MGRPLEKIVMLDTRAEHVQLQKSNSILLTPWTASNTKEETNELISLIPFLEALVIKNVPDVRKVIMYYDGAHIPTAYAKAEGAQKKALLEDWESKRASRQSSAWISSIIQLLGGKPSVEKPPELQIEQIRKQAVNSYLAEKKYWSDNEVSIKAQMEEDRDRQLKEMKGSLLGFLASTAGPKPAAE